MHHSYVDGVPVLRFSEPGPLHATLRFGVGARDETYRMLGISRLVAALAVHAVRQQLPETAEPVVSSGLEETRFTVSGTREEVAECLAVLCRVLPDLPADRLGEVAPALDGEAARSLDPRAVGALNARYGSQAVGLEGHERSQHHLPTADMLLGHAAVWFTRSNAVLTLTGPEPVGLRLPLPPGERPRRFAPQARYPRASWTHRNIDGVALSVETPVGSAAAAVAHRILRERVTAALADQQGPAAPAEAAAALHDSGTVVRLLLAPASASDAEGVAATVWSQALSLARDEPAPAEVARHRSLPEGPSARLRTLDHAARAELFGTPCLDEGSRRRALESVIPRNVRDSWQRAIQRAQLVVPAGLLLCFAGPDGRRLWCTSCWTWDETAPWGQVFREPRAKRAFKRAAERHWMVLTDKSVVSCTPGAYHELRFDDVIALERWGLERNLIGRCGCTIGVDPAWYRDGQRLVRAVDEAVSAELAFDGTGTPPPDHPSPSAEP
ncbi:hypothetical protein AB0G73_31925 [Streptomyces sp. NPDC020719]|uniref:hypothetical protein n=1 Tax=Streptomyces sp. NPDC020719 TaxID=3154896 RepID=UPI0033C23893